MTEQARIDRQTLLRRAAAAAGALCVTPVLVSPTAAEVKACRGQPCPPGRRGNRLCKTIGGIDCRCVNGKCWGGRRGECGPECCDCNYGPATYCDDTDPCSDGARQCICFQNAVTGHCNCVECKPYYSDYPPCDRQGDGSDCPPGTCCMDYYALPTGICAAPCAMTPTRAPCQPGGPRL